MVDRFVYSSKEGREVWVLFVRAKSVDGSCFFKVKKKNRRERTKSRTKGKNRGKKIKNNQFTKIVKGFSGQGGQNSL